MNNLIRYVPIALIAGYFLYNGLGGSSRSGSSDVDLNQVLGITVETIYAFEENHPELSVAKESSTAPSALSADEEQLLIGQTEQAQPSSAQDNNADAAFVQFSQDLTANYNAALPALYAEQITVAPQQDASLIAFIDADANGRFDSGENALYMIEVDGENSRIIATSNNGAVNTSGFSGSGLLTGLLIGNMLSRQRASGSNPASKKTRTAKQAARSRAGSDSHSRGK